MSSKKVPVSVYIDGFNMYHALDKIGDSSIKWINYWKLSESFLRASEFLQAVHLFTSLTPWDSGKRARHQTFIAAQKAMGVQVKEAKFKKNRRHCRTENRRCKFWEEKENDVAITVTMLADAFAKRTKRIVLVTADTDQIPAVKYLIADFPNIELTLAIPPGRKNEARDLGELFNFSPTEITPGRIKACLLPQTIFLDNGASISMPETYATA
ncbi:NYN domain-containing protein [Afipia sp. DC4300-2b1]|uniref:NYN domain-containing protein n=1 Tax=Afipia sp. DC4300-2b1 TaxID=2804672 RepID=UPI003CF8EEF4